tara:strand:+ start:23817 stop:24947 length:1131 start_codon:yes stop_codon:yes gene_type:complete
MVNNNKNKINPMFKEISIIGCGLYGALSAYLLQKQGYHVTVFDERDHIGGNIYTEKFDDFHIHKYGPHIFHTSEKKIWDFVNNFTEFTPFVNSPLAISEGKLYNLPFNMNTFNQLWGIKCPNEARAKINSQTSKYKNLKISNLEEQALAIVGEDIYKTFIKGYTEKQWGRDPKKLSPSIIKRIPLRFTFNNNYFNDVYQGIPKLGYTDLIKNLIYGIKVELNTKFNLEKIESLLKKSKVIYTGALDELFLYKEGKLDYRSLRFESKTINKKSFQGNAVVNYCDKEIPYTRITEHKHFNKSNSEKTVITYEYSKEYKNSEDRFYPISNEKNNSIHKKYKEYADTFNDFYYGGRLADYKYYDMHVIIPIVLKRYGKIS